MKPGTLLLFGAAGLGLWLWLTRKRSTDTSWMHYSTIAEYQPTTDDAEIVVPEFEYQLR